MKNVYNNPIIRGFFPDPSIVRVNDDFYMVNSTFQYFPAIVIQHSKDLVHWEIIGHAVTENEHLDLSELADSHGIWAPDISYFNGEFYIFATLRLNNYPENQTGQLRKNLVMKSKNPEGPYSKPVALDLDYIDPSHFIDDDGTHYMITAPGITITKLNENCDAVTAPSICVWEGTGLNAVEGPHILKKDGYYYAIVAEGGTEYGHQISVARARNLFGEYELCPYNPILKQKDENAQIQRAGHGKLVQLQNGDWWVVYLCGRTNEGRFTTLGRETALDPVRWTSDGWPIINDLKGPSSEQLSPALPTVTYEEKYFDDFDSDKLGFHWEFARNPKHECWSLTERNNYFRLQLGDFDLDTIKNYNTLLRREKEHTYEASIKLNFLPEKNEEQAGLTCYYGIHNFIKLCLVFHDGFKVRLSENRNDIITIINEIDIPYQGEIYLKACVHKQERSFYYSVDNKEWVCAGVISDCRFLSDEGVSVGKHHTGTLVGIYGYNGGNGSRVNADFDWFSYE